jgi:hypothetical protein
MNRKLVHLYIFSEEEGRLQTDASFTGPDFVCYINLILSLAGCRLYLFRIYSVHSPPVISDETAEVPHA